MAVQLDGDDPTAPVINVTPLVDVVLVLLIVFMVVTPLMAKRFWVHTPRQEQSPADRTAAESTPPLVLRIDDQQRLAINGAAVGVEELPEKLRRMFAARTDHVLFFDADDRVSYGFAVEVLDRARAGGAVTIATLTKPLAQ